MGNDIADSGMWDDGGVPFGERNYGAFAFMSGIRTNPALPHSIGARIAA